MTHSLSVDQQTIQGLLAAFDTTQADCRAADAALASTSASLAGGWQGEASSAYGASLARWQEGLSKVESALNSITGDMSTYRTATARTEQTSSQNASWT